MHGYKPVAIDGRPVPDMLDLVNARLSLENVYGSYSGLDLVLHSYKRLKNVLPDLEQSAGVTYTLSSLQGQRCRRPFTGVGSIRKMWRSGRTSPSAGRR